MSNINPNSLIPNITNFELQMETKMKLLDGLNVYLNWFKKKIRMTRLGFLFILIEHGWGHNVILNLINLIYEDKDYKAKPRIQIIIFTNSKKLSKYSINQKVDIIENKQIFDQNLLTKIIDKFSLICFGKTIFFENFLLKYKLNYISYSILLQEIKVTPKVLLDTRFSIHLLSRIFFIKI